MDVFTHDSYQALHEATTDGEHINKPGLLAHVHLVILGIPFLQHILHSTQNMSMRPLY